MSKSPQRIAATLLLMLLMIAGGAQSQRLGWKTSGPVAFAFQISNTEAQKLLTRHKSDSVIYRMLHTQVDTFNVTHGWTRRPDRGHFILAQIIDNKLYCSYVGILPYQVFLLREYDALALQVVDREGNVRKDARVRFKHRLIATDPDTHTVRIANEDFSAGRQFVSVELEGFRSFFEVEKKEKPYWSPSSYNADSPDFYSYLVTDKNRYRPGEKVRFKSYALSHVRMPLQKPLEIWVTGSKSVKIGALEPHRPGSFAGEFVLHDSLKMTLDKTYSLSLRDSKGRYVAQCTFRYEDYQLTGDHLEIELTSEQHYYPAANAVTVRATDSNGLPVAGARTRVVVRPQGILETFQPVLYVPDTLITIERELSMSAETRIEIPAAIFNQSSMNYTVDVTLLSNTEQQLEQTKSAVFHYRQYAIESRLSADSIVYELRHNGVVMHGVSAELSFDDAEYRAVTLPYRHKIHPALKSAALKTAYVSQTVELSSMQPRLEIVGGLERDSFLVSINNPHKLAVSWQIYRGSELVEKGFGTELSHRSFIADRSMSYYVDLSYTYGGEERLKQREYRFNDRQLDVALELPERIYPGQTVDAVIKVTNQAGYPVGGVDLTAFGVTSKLNYTPRALPDYGTLSAQRESRVDFEERPVNKHSMVFNLDYNRWARRAGLDTMKYYQFLYPGPAGFSHRVPLEDSTQFSIYIVKAGAEQKSYVVEVDRVPVYYSWTTIPPKHSIYVDPHMLHEVTVRLWDRVIIFDSLLFERDRKTIISVDLDHLPEFARQTILFNPSARRSRAGYATFTETEQSRYLKYTAQFDRVTGPAYLVSGKRFTPVTSSPHPDRVLAGPIQPGSQTIVSNHYSLAYQFKGGGSYSFDDNVVYREPAKGLLPGRLMPQEGSPSSTLDDLALTKEQFLHRDEWVTPWITKRIDATDYVSGLTILLPEDKKQTGIYGVLFQDPTLGSVSSACSNGTTNGVKLLPRGRVHLIVLYNDGTYLKSNDLMFRIHQQVWVDMRGITRQLPDSSTSSWKQQAAATCFPQSAPRIISLRHPQKARRGYSGNVSGTVYDESGYPLPGVNIVIKGTDLGTVTDIEGNFSLAMISPDDQIVVSFIGYRTQEMNVSAGSLIAMQMEPDVTQLQEVVVTGYSVQLRGSLAYSVSSVLQGRVAGVQVQNTRQVNLAEAHDSQDQRAAEQQLYHELLLIDGMRSNFTDVAFWEPKLYTDRKGVATFSITFPDDITRWNAVVYAMNRRLQTGMIQKSVRSYKPIMAQLDVPRFLVHGDSAFAHGNLSSYLPDTPIEGSFRWQAPGVSIDSSVTFHQHLHASLPLLAYGTDTIRTSYEFLRTDGYRDGERRSIPILDKGTLRAEGSLSAFTNGDRRHISANDGERVTVEILGNSLDLFALEARHLVNYQYACNEQLASKLLGLIAFQYAMRFEEKVFRYEGDVKKIIQRLLKNQNKEFLWSWWDVSPQTSYWISAHILRALKVARDAGYAVDLNIKNIASKASYKFDLLESFSFQDADLLQALAEWKAPLKYGAYVARIDTLLWQRERYLSVLSHRDDYRLLRERLLLLEVRQLSGLPFQRDSLLRYRQEAMRGEIFFSEHSDAFDWYRDDLATNAVAYRIVRRDTALQYLLAPMQQFFVSNRTRGQWNTYQGANLLVSVMPDLLSMGASRKHLFTIAAAGKFAGTIEKLPFKVMLEPGEYLDLRKVAGLPTYLMQYTTRRVTEAARGGEGFMINTVLAGKSQELQAGKLVKMFVDVTVRKSARAEYVMIEVPIPAACSYTEEKRKSYYNETHREYYKDRVNIYFEHMAPGDYRFEIELLPRFTGQYQINPAQISLMYAPVINANTALQSVRVVN